MPPAPAQSGLPAGLVDESYLASFESTRARSLRVRIIWLCVTYLGSVTLSTIGTLFDLAEPTFKDGEPRLTTVNDLVENLLLGLIFAGTLAYLLLWRPDRRHLLRAMVVMTVGAVACAVYYEVSRSLIQPQDFVADRVVNADPHKHASMWATIVVCLVTSVALVLVPMRWRESLRLVLPGFVVYLAIMAFIARPPVGTGIAYALMAAVVLAFFGWFSAKRYRAFDARFQNDQLRGRFGELSAEMAHARRLHEALLPSPIEGGPVRMSFVYEPMRQIGGDFVFAHSSRSGALHVVLIDVAGHGVASALAVNRLHGELKRFFLLSDDPEPGMVINDLNAYVYAALACEGMFATGVCLRFDGPGAKVAWSSAGHPPAMLRSARGDSVLELGSTCPMLGALPPELFDPSPRTMTMVPGDALVAFTDGLFECRDASGRELGLAQVVTLTRAAQVGELGAIARELAQASRAHRHGRVSDDTLVVEVRLGEVVGTPTNANEASTTPVRG